MNPRRAGLLGLVALLAIGIWLVRAPAPAPEPELPPQTIGVSLSDELIAFADREAARRGLSRSGLIAALLEAEGIRDQTRRYLDAHGWDVCDDETGWREYQQRRMAKEYGADD